MTGRTMIDRRTFTFASLFMVVSRCFARVSQCFAQEKTPTRQMVKGEGSGIRMRVCIRRSDAHFFSKKSSFWRLRFSATILIQKFWRCRWPWCISNRKFGQSNVARCEEDL
jgi:hypothetical protein